MVGSVGKISRETCSGPETVFMPPSRRAVPEQESNSVPDILFRSCREADHLVGGGKADAGDEGEDVDCPSSGALRQVDAFVRGGSGSVTVSG